MVFAGQNSGEHMHPAAIRRLLRLMPKAQAHAALERVEVAHAGPAEPSAPPFDSGKIVEPEQPGEQEAVAADHVGDELT